MFTGLVETIGTFVSLETTKAGARMNIRAPRIAAEVKIGDSVAVNGCCLTAARQDDDLLGFDLLRETLDRTSLGALQPGGLVNLERALAANGRLGGHFVQGHVDIAAEVLAFDPVEADWRLEVALPPEFAHYVVSKGSIAIDGISLTIAEVREASFVVWIIPHTRDVTNLATCTVGQRVNLEFDLLAKYVERLLATRES